MLRLNSCSLPSNFELKESFWQVLVPNILTCFILALEWFGCVPCVLVCWLCVSMLPHFALGPEYLHTRESGSTETRIAT